MFAVMETFIRMPLYCTSDTPCKRVLCGFALGYFKEALSLIWYDPNLCGRNGQSSETHIISGVMNCEVGWRLFDKDHALSS